MFHKYDFGTASQISSRRWSQEPLEPETSTRLPVGATILLAEVCAIAALLLIPHFSKNATLALQNHHHTAHAHHALNKHIG